MISRIHLLLLIGIPLPLYAAQTVDTSLPLLNLIQVILALALVLVVIFGAATLFRRFSGALGNIPSCMKVVSALMVGQRERVIIVELDDEWLVLGVTAHTINLLSRMPRKNAPAVVLPTDPFARWFKAALSKTRQRSNDRHP